MVGYYLSSFCLSFQCYIIFEMVFYSSSIHQDTSFLEMVIAFCAQMIWSWFELQIIGLSGIWPVCQSRVIHAVVSVDTYQLLFLRQGRNKIQHLDVFCGGRDSGKERKLRSSPTKRHNRKSSTQRFVSLR